MALPASLSSRCSCCTRKVMQRDSRHNFPPSSPNHHWQDSSPTTVQHAFHLGKQTPAPSVTQLDLDGIAGQTTGFGSPAHARRVRVSWPWSPTGQRSRASALSKAVLDTPIASRTAAARGLGEDALAWRSRRCSASTGRTSCLEKSVDEPRHRNQGRSPHLCVEPVSSRLH